MGKKKYPDFSKDSQTSAAGVRTACSSVGPCTLEPRAAATPSVVVTSILGIDVSKLTLDASVRTQGRKPLHVKVANTPQGFDTLASWLTKHTVTLDAVGLEATSVYSKAITEFFWGRGVTVYLANPKQVHSYMGAGMRRVKTDKADAEAIANFTNAMRPELHPWKPVPTHYQELRECVRHLKKLKDRQASVEGSDEPVAYYSVRGKKVAQRSHKALHVCLGKQIKQVERDIHACINANSDMKQRYALLTSATSVAFVTATTYMAEVPDVRRFASAKQLECYAGLTPRIKQSGAKTPESHPISKIGNQRLRTAFFQSSLSAATHNQSVSGFAHRLRCSNKPGNVVQIAVARKMLHLLYTMDKNNTPFDPNYQRQQAAPAVN